MSQLHVRVEELSPVVRRIQIDVPPERVTQVTENVYRRLGRTVKLRGYRQGHVPRHVVEKYFADQVRSDVAREVVQTTFPEALDSVKLSPVAEPTVEPESLKPGEAFRYTARVEVRPDVKLGQYKGLEVSVKDATVAEKAVEDALEQLRESHSSLVPLEGRDTAETGDFGDVSYEFTVEGSDRPAQKRDGGLVKIEAGQFIDGHGEQLVGMKIGETREFSETFSDEHSPELAGKTAQFKVTLSGLKKRELPALDDEFAKDARGVETLGELRQKLREELEKRANDAQRREKRDAILEALVEKNPIEVPPALVDHQATRIATNFVYSLMRQGMQIDENSPIVQQLKNDALPRATTEVKTYFLLDAVAKAENFQVSADDLNKKLKEIADEEGQPLEKITARYRTPQALSGLMGLVQNERAMDLLEQESKVTIKPAEEKTAEASTESGANS
jgi:trigger factor